MKKIITIISLAAVFLGLPLISQATPTLEFENKRLVGAKHVKVGWRFFDVEFIDGSCVSLFNGCDSSDDFAFNSLPSAQQALQALIDTVLVRQSNRKLPKVQGCKRRWQCRIITPFALTPSNNALLPTPDVLAAGAVNFDAFASFQSYRLLPTAGTGFSSDSTANSPDGRVTTFARFSQVPEPSSLTLFALALASLGFARRQTRK